MPVVKTFFVAGEPVTKGSIRAFVPRGWTRPVLTSTGGKELKAWESNVSWTAKQEGVKPLPGAVSLTLTFELPRPKSLPKKVAAHTKKPDIDKLARAVCDALTGIAYADDSQIVSLTVSKRYATDGAVSGCKIAITDGGSPDHEPAPQVCP